MSSESAIKVHKSKWQCTKKGFKNFSPRYGRVWIKVSNKDLYLEKARGGMCSDGLIKHKQKRLTVYVCDDPLFCAGDTFIYCSECNTKEDRSLGSFYTSIVESILDSADESGLVDIEIYGDLDLYKEDEFYRERVNNYVICVRPVWLLSKGSEPLVMKYINKDKAIEGNREIYSTLLKWVVFKFKSAMLRRKNARKGKWCRRF